MKSFIQHIAAFSEKHYAGNLQELNIILPNRRAGLFLLRELGRQQKKARWAPRVYSIEEFVFSQTGLTPAPQTDLLFELYDAYAEADTRHARTFEDFAGWGPKLLKDFGELDAWTADPHQVFSFLSEARMIQKWELTEKQLTDFDKNYLRFFQNLEQVYYGFREKILEKDLAYYELAVRLAAENPSRYFNGKGNYLIAGFNALSKAEQNLFGYLAREHQARIFWDADSYYVDDTGHEAGKFIRKHLNDSRLQGIRIDPKGFETPKTITIKGLNGHHLQAKYAANILKETITANKAEAEKTAVVLADEELLIPLLNALPGEIKNINITMSYPYRKTQIYSLITDIFSLYEYGKTDSSHRPLFYHNALKKVVGSPLISEAGGDVFRPLLRAMGELNIVYISADTFARYCGKSEFATALQEILYRQFDNNTDVLTLIINILDLLINQGDTERSAELYFASLLRKEINRMEALFSRHKAGLTPGVIRRLFTAVTRLSGIPFQGEPLQGLQIMGVLETRALDFENIIYLSFNEGVIPQSKSFSSFILPEIRKEYGMPMPYDGDAMFAYHFYRSIQRAKNITLIYNTAGSGMSEGEMSRFARQLLFELPLTKAGHHIESLMPVMPSPLLLKAPVITVEKTEEIYQKLTDYMVNRGLSPSTFTQMRNCGLWFYFAKITGLKKDDEVEEVMGSNIRGTAIHDTLEAIFCPENQKVKTYDRAFFEQALQNFKPLLTANYKKTYKEGNIDTGYNYLLRRLDEMKVENYLKLEKENNDHISDVQCEQKLSCTIPVEITGKTLNIKLFGYADRIDRKDGMLRIIDYKTGKVEHSDVALPARNQKGKSRQEQLFDNRSKDKALQLLFYSLIYSRQNQFTKNISPAIISFKGKPQYFYLKWDKNQYVTQENLEEFQQMITGFLQEFLRRDIPFEGQEDDKKCKYCDFRIICRKAEE